MRFPDERLDDFQLDPAQELAGPPQAVALRFTGETEVVKPLARYERFVKSKAAPVEPAVIAAPHQPSRFPRWLAAAGTVAIIALIAAAGFMIANYRPRVEPVGPVDVAADQPPAAASTPADEPAESDIMSAADPTSTLGEFPAGRDEAARPRREPPHVFRSTIRPRRHLLPRPRFIVSDFVPTTLIIYIENGAIKTRIEPQPTVAYKKP